MHLKRLEIKGFKSFADKVSLEFENGITAVVGPNGSGKSNIADAIRWVLGEQSAKTLRGLKMEDIIFAGTENRKSLGIAEVSLTIDNSDGFLPLEYTEITVSRRLYRSGESEYLINNTSSRLKDILELFMDTGVGRDGYSLIGQGKVDEILSNRPEDRRNVFEEAAGIVKYKNRKLESEKKLSATRDNIIRISDIIEELQNQIDPLKDQSEAAKRYLNLREELKHIEISLLLVNHGNSVEKLKTLNQNFKDISENMELSNTKKEKILNDLKKYKEEYTKVEGKYDSVKDEIHSSQKNIETLKGELNLNEEKINNNKRDIERLDGDIVLRQGELTNTKNEVEEKEADDKNLIAEISELEENIHKLNSELDLIGNDFIKYEESIENGKQGLIQSMKDIADTNNEVNSLKIMIENNEKRLQSLKNEINLKEDKKNQGNLKLELIRDELERAKEELSNITSKREEYEKALLKLNNNKRELLLEKDKVFSELKTKEGRGNALLEMEKQREGFSRAVKAVLSKYLGDKRLSGTVSDIITVPREYETAIETALSGAVQNIIIDNEHTAGEMINYLKENNLGRATFLPISTVLGKKASINIEDSRGLLKVASDLVSFDKKYEKIVNYLLGRVLVCDNLKAATEAAKKLNFGIKIVTLDGDVINPGGSYTGGSRGSNIYNVISRKNELKDIEEIVKQKRTSLMDITNKLKEIEVKIEEYKKEFELKGELIQKKNIEIRDIENNNNAVNNDIKGFIEDIYTIGLEINGINEENDKFNGNITKLEEKLINLRELEDNININIEKLQENYRDIRDKRMLHQNSLTQYKISFAEKKKVHEGIEGRINQYKKDIEGIEEGIKTLNNEISEKERLIQSYETLKGEILKKIDCINEEYGRLNDSLKELEELKLNIQRDISCNEMDLKNLEESISDLSMSAHKIEVSKSRLEAEGELFLGRLWEEYELTIPQALKYKVELKNISEASRKVQGLKNDIKALGDVNVNAIDEFKRVKDRYEFLTGQRADLIQAEESLLKIIGDIDIRMKEEFKDKFKVIRENFKETFMELFGGGFADLELENDDILNSGIEIIVQPPGKKLQSLTLLSGGERGLAAIALIFAMLKLKPTPFCVLDEIEASLDDSNVLKFSNYLKKYANKTQFILITHRKGSMAVSNVLYGVTMEEKGISKVISLKLKGGK